MAETITVDTADGPMPAYLAAPEGASAGGVLVIQEAFGVTSHIEDVARRLAAAGWTALAPALFHRQGSPVFGYDDIEVVRPIMGALSAEGLGMDLDAALGALGERGFPLGRCAVVGFCMGGTVALLAATRHALGAAVTFYGGGVAEGRFGLPSLIELAPSLRTPWLGLYGDRDAGIPVEDVERLQAAAAEATVPAEVLRYPEGQHGFHCDDRPSVFDADIAADAWQRTMAWFDQHIPAPTSV